MINKKQSNGLTKFFNPMSIFTVSVTLISFIFFLAHLSAETSMNTEAVKRIEGKVDTLTTMVIQLQQQTGDR
jgi:hypothetical protein